MTARDARVASPAQTIGPFFHVGPACTDRLGCMLAAETAGDRIVLRVRVLDGDGQPVPDALIELFQADAAGQYASPAAGHDNPAPRFTGFGRLGTDGDGWAIFETVRPGAVTQGDARQAPHVNVCLHARGLTRHLYTRLYFAGDPALGADPVLGVVPQTRRDTLLARASDNPGTWEFVIRLQGDDETVFFDL